MENPGHFSMKETEGGAQRVDRSIDRKIKR